MLKGLVIDALWMGEVARQVLLVVTEMGWVTLTDTQERSILGLVSLIITGIVGMRTVSARVAERAGTSVEQLKAVAQPMVDARLTVSGSDSHKVPSSPMDDDAGKD